MDRYSYNRQAASPISMEELPPVQQKIVQILVDHRYKPTMVWDGIHGYIVEFDGSERFTVDLLKDLVRHPLFRWIEANSRGAIAVGM